MKACLVPALFMLPAACGQNNEKNTPVKNRQPWIPLLEDLKQFWTKEENKPEEKYYTECLERIKN